MPRPCGHKSEIERGQPYVPGECRACWLFFNDYSYYKSWKEGENVIFPIQKDTSKKRISVKSEDSELLDYFDRIVLINLARRPDRLEKVVEELETKGWCFGDIEIFEAVDGHKLPVPYGWSEGGGAWGCMQSHRQILERAIMDDISRLLVLEDDIIVKKTFVKDVKKFIKNVPDNWDQLMLGGQHNSVPIEVSPGIVKCTDSGRTHAYAIRGNFMKELYANFCSPNSKVHCDWIMGPLQKSFNVYAPDPFLVGQSESHSDICGRVNPAKFWIPPSGKEHLILLRCSKELLPELRRRGIHTGHQRNHNDVDVGVEEAFSQENPIPRLTEWVHDVMWEVKSDETMIAPACWHTKASIDHLKKCWNGPVYEVTGNTVEEIMGKINSYVFKVSMI